MVITMLNNEIGWKQSHSVRNNITELLEEILYETNEINRLQFEIIQKQLLDNKVTKSEDALIADIEFGLNHSLSFENVDILQNICEIKSKQEIIQENIKSISINLADDSDLIFMGLIDAGKEIESQENSIDMQISTLQEEIEMQISDLEDKVENWEEY